MKHIAGTILALAVTGCAAKTSGPGGGTDVPAAATTRTIAYVAPSAPQLLTYEFADTTSSDIQAGPVGSIRVNIGNKGVADLRFEPAGSDQKVTFTLKEFAGSFSNSAGGGTVTATAADMKGAAVMTVTPRGVVTITQRPELSTSFRAVSGSESIYRRFFARVPGRAAAPGATWTDTLSIEETNDGVTSKLRNIVVSTYARDTAIAGKTFYLITGDGDRSLEVRGTTQGVEIVQRLAGKMSTITLWDPERNVAAFRDETATLTGTFDLPAMSMLNLPITATGRSVLRLR